MAKRRKAVKIFHKYECTITGEQFKTTQKATNPDELISINAYYELNADKDDRPEAIRAKIKALTPEETAVDETTAANEETSKDIKS